MRLILLSLFLSLVFRPAPVKAQVERFAEYQLQDEAVLIDTVDDNDSVSSASHTLIPPRDLQTTRAYNAQQVQVRAFDKKKWREITAGADFRETSKPSTNFSIPWLGPVLKVLAYPVIIAMVVALLYLVIKNVTLDLKIRRDKLKGADIETQLDSIDHIDLDALLDHARKNGDFKVAVRLYYLKLLKKLDEMEKIVWKKDKTNRDYLSELFAKDFHFQQVRGLTRSYESVWYGDHEINRESLQRICLQFESAFAELNSPAAP